MKNRATEYAEMLDLPYTKDNDGIRLLDMYLPKLDEPCPALVFFHGGGLEEGGRKEEETPVLKSLAGRGIALVSADYRIYPNAAFPDYIEDAAAAVAFAVNYGKERKLFSKIFVGGSSAGAYLAMHLCFNGRYFSEAGVDPHDICGYFFDAGQPTVHYNILRERGLDTRRIMIDEAAPQFYLDENFIKSGLGPEMLFITADGDLPCRYEQNQMMIKNLEQFGYDMSKVGFRLMKGFGHTTYIPEKGPGGSYIYADIAEGFIREGAASQRGEGFSTST